MALTTAVMWGLLPIALKAVLRELDSVTITWFRFFVSALLLGVYLRSRGRYPWARLADRSLLLRFAAGIACLLCNFLLFLLGLDHTTASATQVLIQLGPMLMLVFSLFLFKERFSLGQGLGVALFLLGLALFFNRRLPELLAAQGSYALGVLLVFLAALLWAVYGVLQKQLLKNFSSLEVLWLIFVAGSLAFLPWVNWAPFGQLSPLAWACLLFAALNTLVAYGTFAGALGHWEASRVSATITIVPILTLLFVHLTNLLVPGFIEPEPMNWLSWAGAGLVVLGSMAAALLRAR